MSKLQSEIIAFINERITDTPRINKAWLVHEFITTKGELPDGDYDREFYRDGAYAAVSTAAGKAIGKVGSADPEASPQLILPGYDQLQVAYSVKNERGEIELVQTRLISDEQLLERATEYEAQASGLLLHADEIRRYVANRSQSSFAV